MQSFRNMFVESVTFSNGEPGEKEVYLMVPDYGSVVIKPSSSEAVVIEDLEEFGVKIDSSIKKLIAKALKAIKKK